MKNVLNSNIAIFSIKPDYAAKILSGEKKVEYRKYKCSIDIKKIIIYATSPIKMVVGEVGVEYVIKGTPDKLWELTYNNSGISKIKYDEYFKDKEIAFAYKLINPIKYETPHKLNEYGIKNVPQSFCYIKKEIFCKNKPK